jgi:SET domain-containing protein
MSSKSPVSGGRRIQTRRSGVHGNGVFAVQDIAEGETLIEYKGEVISWKEALRRHPHDPAQPNHTFYFHIDDDRVIDGKVDGNAARWINHSCAPNCEADEQDGRVFIKALRRIAAGEELNYDYGLVIDEPYTEKLLAEFPCWCGSADCRGTLLAPKSKKERKKDKKIIRKAEKKAWKKALKQAAKAARKSAGAGLEARV